jgi:site-specific DNA-methyltransferase (adenine-specific)
MEDITMSFIDSMPTQNRHVEWFTPTKIKKELIKEFGVFDLDVATHKTNPMDALRFFTKEDDAFKFEWEGENLYMNPPYGREISKWIDYALKEFEQGRFKRMVMLLPSRTCTKWFHLLLSHPHVKIRFFKGRLRFNDSNPAPMPSILVILQYGVE